MQIKVYIGEKDGYLMLYTQELTINLHETFKEAGVKPDEYSFESIKSSIIELLKTGADYQGILLFLKGKLDSKKELKRYSNLTGISYNYLRDIVHPNRP